MNHRRTVCLGLISDTHMPERWPALPPAIFELFKGVDLLLHAGDIGELWVLDQLSTIAPVVAVHGNDDTADSQRELPYQQLITIAGQRILLWHSHLADRSAELADRRVDWTLRQKLERMISRAQEAGATICVFGHWHMPLVLQQDSVMVINPGAIASGNPFTRQLVQTVALLEVAENGNFTYTHFNLAEPERPYFPAVDLDAGFPPNLALYSDTILSPDLAILPQQRLWEIIHLDIVHLYPAVLRVAHRCWSGERLTITRADLITELQRDATITPEIKNKAIEAIKQLPRESDL